MLESVPSPPFTWLIPLILQVTDQTSAPLRSPPACLVSPQGALGGPYCTHLPVPLVPHLACELIICKNRASFIAVSLVAT